MTQTIPQTAKKSVPKTQDTDSGLSIPSSYSAADKRKLRRRYTRLLELAAPVLKQEQKARIKQAFELAAEAHKDMYRKSGEPYIYHPIIVAELCLTELGLGTTCVVSALLHDVVEDTNYSLDHITSLFGEEVGGIIDGLTKISWVFARETSLQAENFRKVLFTLSHDVRIILIKIADRLHNMRTLDGLTRSKQLRIAAETNFLYAPMAHRLGLYSIKSELEDLHLKYTQPEAYHGVVAKIKESDRARNRFLRRFILPIEKKLQTAGITVSIKGRCKSIFSIWRKMQHQGIPFEEVYDVLAVRIIIDTPLEEEKELCWRAYSIVTDIYAPNPDRMKDWLSTPKSNGYESLHTTVLSKEAAWVEVQIRSVRMDEVAERGYAAHWKYKEQGVSSNHATLDALIDRLRHMLEQGTDIDAVEFLEDFRADLSKEEIYVFTPKGDTHILPSGSTVLDFAYEIHTELGNRCIGAKINHKLSSITTRLENGDQVEILNSKKEMVSRDWLSSVVSSKATTAIKHLLRQRENKYAREGKEILADLCLKQKLVLDFKDRHLLLRHFKEKDLMSLYHKIGAREIQKKDLRNLAELIQSLKNPPLPKTQKKTTDEKHTSAPTTSQEDALLIGDDLDQLDYTLSVCCNPIPGDEVFGFISGQHGLKIHRTTCHNAPELLAQHGQRVIPAQWASKLNQVSNVCIDIKGIDRMGILRSIMTLISGDMKIEASSVTIKSENGLFSGSIDISIQDTKQLEQLVNRMRAVDGVAYVGRSDSIN